jgi:hypothetical protein
MPKRSQSNGTRTGPFLLTACQSHLKSKTLKVALKHRRDHRITFFLGPTEKKVAIGQRFGIPMGIDWSFTSESKSRGFRLFSHFRIDRKGLLPHKVAA